MGFHGGQKWEAHQAPELILLAQKKWQLRSSQLKQIYGQIKKVPSDCSLLIERQQLHNKIHALKLRFEREVLEKLIANFHSNADLEHMITQFQGDKLILISMSAPVKHNLAHRNELAEALFLPAVDASFA